MGFAFEGRGKFYSLTEACSSRWSPQSVLAHTHSAPDDRAAVAMATRGESVKDMVGRRAVGQKSTQSGSCRRTPHVLPALVEKLAVWPYMW